MYLIETGNTATVHPEFVGNEDYYQGDVHGIFFRSFAYVAGNSVYNSYSTVTNDGEAFCAEPIGGSFSFGDVLSVDGRNIELDINAPSTADFANRAIPFGKVAVIIVNGRGIGQYNLVDWDSIYYDSYNLTATMTLLADWQVEPDETSQYSLQAMIYGVTLYDNYNNGSTKGILLYGNFYDAVVADNHLVNSDGIGTLGLVVNSTLRFNSNYYIRITRNLIEGVSPITGSASIAIHSITLASTTVTSMTQAYAFDIRGNTIISTKTSTFVGASEIPNITGIFATVDSYSWQYGTNTIIRNIMILDNVVEDSLYGVSLTKQTSGVLVMGNDYYNVDEEFRYLVVANSYNYETATDTSDSAGSLVENVVNIYNNSYEN